MSTLAILAHLPVTVTVAENGSVAIDHPRGTVAMSRFSPRAGRLSVDFGPGTHVLATADDILAIPLAAADITAALA